MHSRLSGMWRVSRAALVFVLGFTPALAEDRSVEINGTEIQYMEQGSGEPVVFVHAAVGDLRAWAPYAGPISEKHRYVALTQRYFGTGDWSDDEGKAFGETTHSEDLLAFVDALGAGPVHLIGWSYGANVATIAAMKGADRIRSMVLFEPALSSLIQPGPEGEAAGAAAKAMWGTVGDALEQGDNVAATRRLIEGVFQLPAGGFDGLPQGATNMMRDNARTMPLLWSREEPKTDCDALGKVETPTLIIHGGDSNDYWKHIASVMDRCMPNGEAAALPGVNHDGPLRDPAGLTRMITDFVARH